MAHRLILPPKSGTAEVTYANTETRLEEVKCTVMLTDLFRCDYLWDALMLLRAAATDQKWHYRSELRFPEGGVETHSDPAIRLQVKYARLPLSSTTSPTAPEGVLGVPKEPKQP